MDLTETTTVNSAIVDLVEIYCDVRDREKIIIDTSEVVILCIIMLINVGFWIYKLVRGNRRPAITLNA